MLSELKGALLGENKLMRSLTSETFGTELSLPTVPRKSDFILEQKANTCSPKVGKILIQLLASLYSCAGIICSVETRTNFFPHPGKKNPQLNNLPNKP